MLRLSHGRVVIICLSHPSSRIAGERGGQSQGQVKKPCPLDNSSVLQCSLTIHERLAHHYHFLSSSASLQHLCGLNVTELPACPLWVVCTLCTLPHFLPAPEVKDWLRTGRHLVPSAPYPSTLPHNPGWRPSGCSFVPWRPDLNSHHFRVCLQPCPIPSHSTFRAGLPGSSPSRDSDVSC